jgi:hypothetical protein
METYIKPCQAKMAEAAPKLKLVNPVDQTRLELLPLLMKGHILELTQAIGGMASAPQAKEVEECAETLGEYLKLASVQYKVTPYLAPRAMMDAEYMGPFGCGFWGKRYMFLIIVFLVTILLNLILILLANIDINLSI